MEFERVKRHTDKILAHTARVTDQEPIEAIAALLLAARSLAWAVDMSRKDFDLAVKIVWETEPVHKQ